MPLRPLPAAPKNDHEAAVWIALAAGEYGFVATAYNSLADCLDDHRKEKVIR